MQHDEQWLGQVQGVLIGCMDSRDDALHAGKIITNACREYGENIATPLEARIVELEASVESWKKEYNELGHLLDKTQALLTAKES